MAENGYEFIIAGRSGKLLKYDLLTSNEVNLLDNLESYDLLNEIAQAGIVSMNLTSSYGHQHLLIGTSNGTVLSLRVKPKIPMK